MTVNFQECILKNAKKSSDDHQKKLGRDLNKIKLLKIQKKITNFILLYVRCERFLRVKAFYLPYCWRDVMSLSLYFLRDQKKLKHHDEIPDCYDNSISVTSPQFGGFENLAMPFNDGTTSKHLQLKLFCGFLLK